LPGVETTRALAAELDKLPAERQALLVQALGNRGDPAALPALLAAVKSAEKGVRLAAIRSLPKIGDASVIPPLIEALASADAETSQAAQDSLSKLPGKEADAAVASLLDSAEQARRLTAIELAGRRRMSHAIPALLKAARDADPQVRLGALRVLGDLAGAEQQGALLELTISAGSPQEMEAAGRALSAVCAKVGNPDTCAEKLAGVMSHAAPALKPVLLRVLCSVGGGKALQAVRIAEHPDVRTPVMTMMDGFIVSGAIGPLQELTTEQVQEFIGPFQAINPLLDSEHPVTVGPFDGLHGWFFEHKARQQQAMDRALKVVDEVAREYAKVSGRRYDLLDPYRMDDAEIAIVVVGSTAGATRMVVDKLRAKGVKAGMVRVRVFRPFPAAEYARVLGGCKVVGVLDRAESFGAEGGPVFLEVRSALYDRDPRPRMLPFIYGLGGRDIFPDDIEEAFDVLRKAASTKRPVGVKRRYLNLRKDEV